MLALAANGMAMRIERGTAVDLVFDQHLSSRSARAGDEVRLHVEENVFDGDRVVIQRGTRVTATVTEVHKNGRFGKNAQIKLDIDPIFEGGVGIPLQPRHKGDSIGGSRGTEAAGAAGAGAFLLGPLGLGAGYFVVGKPVDVKPGDKLDTQVSEDVYIR